MQIKKKNLHSKVGVFVNTQITCISEVYTLEFGNKYLTFLRSLVRS